MNLSIPEYLINQAVKTASGLYQQAKDSHNQSTLKLQREKAAQIIAEAQRPPPSSSAYRVTISPAAMQKMESSDAV